MFTLQATVPRGPVRPVVSIEINHRDNPSTRRGLCLDVTPGAASELTISPRYSTPESVTSRPSCDHDIQLNQLLRHIATLTEMVDQLKDSARTQRQVTTGNVSLPRDIVVS